VSTTRRASAVAAALSLGLSAANASADPQANVGLTIGGAARGQDRELFEEPAFHLGMRGDVLWCRSAATDFGVGPYAELFTHAFDELQVGHGVSLLVPTVDTFPIVFSAGAYGRIGEDKYGFEPGVAAAIFLGTRGHNFSSHYDIAAGLLLQGRIGLGSSEEVSMVIAAHLDAAFLGMPIIYLADAARGGSNETDPVPEDTDPIPEQTARK
jgi:hypothetical protein